MDATNSNGMTTPHSHRAKTNTLNTNDLDFPTGQRQRKDESICIQLALHDHVVHALMCGDYLVCKYGLSYYAENFDALQAFAKKLGVCND